jgi:hypothetical protein
VLWCVPLSSAGTAHVTLFKICTISICGSACAHPANQRHAQRAAQPAEVFGANAKAWGCTRHALQHPHHASMLLHVDLHTSTVVTGCYRQGYSARGTPSAPAITKRAPTTHSCPPHPPLSRSTSACLTLHLLQWHSSVTGPWCRRRVRCAYDYCKTALQLCWPTQGSSSSGISNANCPSTAAPLAGTQPPKVWRRHQNLSRMPLPLMAVNPAKTSRCTPDGPVPARKHSTSPSRAPQVTVPLSAVVSPVADLLLRAQQHPARHASLLQPGVHKMRCGICTEQCNGTATPISGCSSRVATAT